MLSLIFAASLISANAEAIKGESKCFSAPKTFQILDAKSKFKEVSILNGSIVRINSEAPNEPVEVDCRKLTSKETVINQNWNAVKQKTTFSVWDIIIPGRMLKKSLSEIFTLTNKNEFPIQSKIHVSRKNFTTSIRLEQQPLNEKSIHITCASGKEFGVQVAIQNGKEKFASYVNMLDGTPMLEPVPPPGVKKNNCQAESFSIQLASGKIEKTNTKSKESDDSDSTTGAQ